MSIEASIADKLTMLWNLQLNDSKLDEIQILKGELPMEVSDLEDEVAGLDTRIKKMKAVLKESELEISKLQISSKEADANIKRYQKQLDEVKNNREYEALQKEIELAKLDIQLSEKRVREAKGGLEGKKESMTIAEAKFESKQKELEAKKVELQGVIEKTETEEKRLRKQSEKLREGIETRLINAYDKTRRTYRNGIAVATVDRNSCGGCFNNVPPQVHLEIGLHKRVIACEHCGRILVDQSIVSPESMVEA
ncbi:MAG: zinc ribbon domain-containing protein [Saprospiraceae bacterium]